MLAHLFASTFDITSYQALVTSQLLKQFEEYKVSLSEIFLFHTTSGDIRVN